MSTPFYDLASLVVVPSGYKASKVYAQKPLTTDGQLTFSRASTATRVNASGLIETVSSNVPRLDYLGSTCPKLLLEPQRTNSFVYSNDFTHASWNKVGGITITGSQADPNGGTDAFLYSRTLAYDYLSQGISSGAYTISVYAKANTSNFLRIAGSLGGDAIFNLSTGVITSQSSATAQIVSVGNGWYRCSAYIPTSTGTHFIQNFPVANDQNGAGSVYIYQAQSEIGAYPTSIIPTTTAAVTRLADTASKTGVSSLVGGAEGTMFVEGFQNSPVTCVPFQLSDGTNNNRVQIEVSGVGAPLCVVSSGGSTQAVIVGASQPVGFYRKIAITFKANEFKLYENGQLIGTDTSGAIPVSLSAIYLGSESGSVYTGFTYKQILDFKTALTEAQAKELTTL